MISPTWRWCWWFGTNTDYYLLWVLWVTIIIWRTQFESVCFTWANLVSQVNHKCSVSTVVPCNLGKVAIKVISTITEQFISSDARSTITITSWQTQCNWSWCWVNKYWSTRWTWPCSSINKWNRRVIRPSDRVSNTVSESVLISFLNLSTGNSIRL